MKKTGAKKAAVIAAALAVFSLLISVGLHIAGDPRISGGAGVPDVIYLTEDIRLEKAAALKKDHRVLGIRDGTVYYTLTRGSLTEPGYGAFVLGGSAAGGAYEDRQSGSEEVFGDTVIKAVRDGRACVLAAESAGTGETTVLFDGSGGGKWQLEEPRFYGEYIVVRIYYIDCVYRIVGAEG